MKTQVVKRIINRKAKKLKSYPIELKFTPWFTETADDLMGIAEWTRL
jgi:hypothetical protein